MLSKQEIRQKIIKKRKEISKDFILKNSLKIIKIIKEKNIFKNSKNIWIFYPLIWEVDLLPFLWEKNKNFYFPKVEWNDIFFWKIQKISDLKKWSFWLFEPKKIDKNINLDLILVPALAFSLDWKRIWFWKWFYDKYLFSLKKELKTKIMPKLIWVCFEFQIFDNLPQEKQDFLIDEIIF